jgi:hypothetical protein
MSMVTAVTTTLDDHPADSPALREAQRVRLRKLRLAVEAEGVDPTAELAALDARAAELLDP